MGLSELITQRLGSPFIGLADVDRGLAFLSAIDGWTLERQMEITAIPAPTFQESVRGHRMAELFREAGLSDVDTDDIGNVLGWIRPRGEPASPSSAENNPLVLSAHLDTVFPAGTDVGPKWEGHRILAPGISDDGRGLASLLAVARVLVEVGFPLPLPILFVATVGEEGAGNLRGVRHLLDSPGPAIHPAGFISLDGVGIEKIIHRGVGSTRLRITTRGPGGHSWTDFGRPNPIHILGSVVASIQDLALPSRPRTTLTVARWGGGKSINSIPQEAWIEVDLRSEGESELSSLEEEIRLACERQLPGRSGAGENSGAPALHITEIGRRPAGATDPADSLVRAAMSATEALGENPELIGSSTDANVPMSLGIPAITMGAGGAGGGIHTLEEWYENRKGPEGILRALLAVLLWANDPQRSG